MSGFLYCRVGDQRPLRAEDIDAWGLRYAFPDGSFETRPVSDSPGGGIGLVFGPSSAVGVGYYPHKQSWREMPEVEGRPALWVGFNNDSKPIPESLLRTDALAIDLSIRLADGNQWRVPRVRAYDAGAERWECLLPSLLDFDRQGNLFPARPVEKHAYLWSATEKVAAAMVIKAEGVPQVTDREVQDCAIALLQANYKVDVPELVMLGALSTSDSFASIVMAACRGKELLEWLDMIQKKKQRPVSGEWCQHVRWRRGLASPTYMPSWADMMALNFDLEV